MPFASANHALLFRIIVARERTRLEPGFALRRFNGMRDFVSQSQCR